MDNKSEEKKYALVYCRVSSQQQVKDGNGLDSQEIRCIQYCKNKYYAVEKIFREEGVSGGLFERPEMQNLINYIDKNPEKKYVVVFDDLKRLARSIEVHLRIKAELSGRGATYECPNFRVEDSPEGGFVENIIASVAEYERLANRRQVIQKEKARLEKGYWSFGAKIFPYEFIKTMEHGKLLTPMEPQASIVADCLKKFAEGTLLNQTEMKDYLQKRDLYGDGREVKKGIPERLLANIVFYTGYIEYQKWGVSRRKGHHKPIIDDKIMRKIEKRLQKNPPRKLNFSKREQFPLRQLVKCGICGKKMTGSTCRGNGGKYSHYTCNNKKCSADPKNISVKTMHSEYYKLLTLLSPEKDIIDTAEEILKSKWLVKLENISKIDKNNKRIIDSKRNDIEKCLDLSINAKSNTLREKYEARIEMIEQEIDNLENQLIFFDDFNFDEALDHVMDFIGTPALYWERSGIDMKIKIHNLIFPDGLCFDVKNGFGTNEKALFFGVKSIERALEERQMEMAGVEPASKQEINYRRHV